MRWLPSEYAVRNLGRSPLRLSLSVAGAALVVLLVLAAGAFVRGMRQSLAVSAAEDNVILLGAGSEESIERSEIKASVAGQAAASVDGIKTRLGVPYVSPEIHLFTNVRFEPDGQPYPTLLRGVTAPAFLVHKQVRLTEGRAPAPGADEVIVGRLAATRMNVGAANLAVGQVILLDDRRWTIVGHFEAPSTVMDAEVWIPLSDLLVFAKRETVSCVVLTLEDGEFADVEAFAKQRLDLELVAMREGEYYGKLSAFFRPVQVMVWITAALIALGGLLGGLNMMYAAFAARVREIGALQAIGYPRRAILLSLLQESLLTAAVGALVAAAVGILFLDGLAVRFSMGAFGLVVDSSVMLWALASALVLGVVGALPPAWRCLRLPIPVALKTA